MSAAEKLDSKNPLLDKSIVQAFVDGVCKTLKNMAQTDVKHGKAFVEKGHSDTGDIAGLIGMVSGDIKGTITVSFTKGAALKIYENMLDEKYDDLNDEVGDSVGELTNMIYGCAKTTLNEKGYEFEMAIPTVIMGKARITNAHVGTTLVVPFCIDGDKKFSIGITVQV